VLVDLIAGIKPTIPRYCRVNRVIRDIPSTHVVEGNRRTSLRMDIFDELRKRGQTCQCIRCREVREEPVDLDTLEWVDIKYPAAHSVEHFLQFVTPADRIAGYLRLSLPAAHAPDLSEYLPDLNRAALIREVHVYGQSLPVGDEQSGAAQHIGLGKRLLERAAEIAQQAGFHRLAVIASVGTRLYYEARGFTRGELYMLKDLAPTQGEIMSE
jgi:elongator complex protein 3